MRIAENNFIINCNVLVVVEVAQKLRFLNEYGELEPVEPGDRAEVFTQTAEKKFGGTRARSTNKVACLLGLGPKATAVLLDTDEICAPKKPKGAKKEYIYKVSTKEDIILLEKTKAHTLGATFIPAPFLRHAILDFDSKEPDNLILEANRIGNIFANQDGNC